MRLGLLTSPITAVLLTIAVFLLVGVSSAQQPSANPKPQATQTPPASTADDNPFPEDISRKAADAAKQQQQALPQEPAAVNPDTAAPPSSNESSSGNGFTPPPDEDVSAPANPERRKLSVYGTPRECQTKTGATVPCGKLGIGGTVDGNDDSKTRIAPAADHLALKDKDIADLYVKDGNYAGALGRYEEALSFVPDDEEAAFGVAECASKLGKREEAIEAYKTYLKLAPQGKKANQARKAIQNLTATARH